MLYRLTTNLSPERESEPQNLQSAYTQKGNICCLHQVASHQRKIIYSNFLFQDPESPALQTEPQNLQKYNLGFNFFPLTNQAIKPPLSPLQLFPYRNTGCRKRWISAFVPASICSRKRGRPLPMVFWHISFKPMFET